MAVRKKAKKAKVKKKSRSKGGKAVRRKGHQFERDCAVRFRESGLFPEAKRHLENQKEEAQGFDLDNTGRFKIQCKAKVYYSQISAIEEVQCQPGDVPALLTKGDNKKPVFCLYFEDFLKILQDPSKFLGLNGKEEISVDDF